jgi:hypothetical protein
MQTLARICQQSDSNIPKFLKLANENQILLPREMNEVISSDAKGTRTFHAKPNRRKSLCWHLTQKAHTYTYTTDLIFSMLDGDHKRRISASKACQHPWIQFEGAPFHPSIRSPLTPLQHQFLSFPLLPSLVMFVCVSATAATPSLFLHLCPPTTQTTLSQIRCVLGRQAPPLAQPFSSHKIPLVCRL